MKKARAHGLLETIGILWELPNLVSDIWGHINRKHVDGKIEQTCIYCGHTRKAKQLFTSRWALHLVEGCEKVCLDVSKQVYESRKDTLKTVHKRGNDGVFRREF